MRRLATTTSTPLSPISPPSETPIDVKDKVNNDSSCSSANTKGQRLCSNEGFRLYQRGEYYIKTSAPQMATNTKDKTGGDGNNDSPRGGIRHSLQHHGGSFRRSAIDLTDLHRRSKSYHRTLIINRNEMLANFRCPVHGTYLVKGKIGQGSWGTVHLALERSSGIQRAIKKIPKRFSGCLSRFRQEMVILKGFDHPRIARLFETYEDYANLYIVMEYCAGGELFTRLADETKFPEAIVAHLIKQILSAVAHCHGRHVAHRDLKPENFLFLERDIRSPLKLVDFGLAKILTDKNEAMSSAVGSIYYVAPELVSAHYTKACDLWSVGVIMYMLLCGVPPFLGDSDQIIADKILNEEISFSRESVWRQVSPLAKNLLRRLLCRNPEDRISAYAALVHPWLRVMSPSPLAVIVCALPRSEPLTASSTVGSPRGVSPNLEPKKYSSDCNFKRHSVAYQAQNCQPRFCCDIAEIASDHHALSCAFSKRIHYGDEIRLENRRLTTPELNVRTFEPSTVLINSRNRVLRGLGLKNVAEVRTLVRKLITQFRRYAGTNPLKRAILNVVAQQLESAPEMNFIRNLFDLFDGDGDGVINSKEFMEAIFAMLSVEIPEGLRLEMKMRSSTHLPKSLSTRLSRRSSRLRIINFRSKVLRLKESSSSAFKGGDTETETQDVADGETLVVGGRSQHEGPPAAAERLVEETAAEKWERTILKTTDKSNEDCLGSTASSFWEERRQREEKGKMRASPAISDTDSVWDGSSKPSTGGDWGMIIENECSIKGRQHCAGGRYNPRVLGRLLEMVGFDEAWKMKGPASEGSLSEDDLDISAHDLKHEMRELVNYIDLDGNGKIEYSEFVAACLDPTSYLSDTAAKAAFRVLDRDQDGKIGQMELKSLFGWENGDAGPERMTIGDGDNNKNRLEIPPNVPINAKTEATTSPNRSLCCSLCASQVWGESPQLRAAASVNNPTCSSPSSSSSPLKRRRRHQDWYDSHCKASRSMAGGEVVCVNCETLYARSEVRGNGEEEQKTEVSSAGLVSDNNSGTDRSQFGDEDESYSFSSPVESEMETAANVVSEVLAAVDRDGDGFIEVGDFTALLKEDSAAVCALSKGVSQYRRRRGRKEEETRRRQQEEEETWTRRRRREDERDVSRAAAAAAVRSTRRNGDSSSLDDAKFWRAIKECSTRSAGNNSSKDLDLLNGDKNSEEETPDGLDAQDHTGSDNEQLYDARRFLPDDSTRRAIEAGVTDRMDLVSLLRDDECRNSRDDTRKDETWDEKRYSRDETRNAGDETRNTGDDTRNDETRNLRDETRNLRDETRNLRDETRNLRAGEVTLLLNERTMTTIQQNLGEDNADDVVPLMSLLGEFKTAIKDDDISIKNLLRESLQQELKAEYLRMQ